MKRKITFIFSLTLLMASFVVVKEDNTIVKAATYSPTLSETYYDSVANLEGEELLEELAVLTQNNHKTFTSYEDIKTMNAYSDADPNDSTKLLDFYTGWSVPSAWDGGNTWNREHVWCQSLSGGLYGTSGAGSDIHHIRPTISSINTSRNNALYTDRNSCGNISMTSYTYSGSEVSEYKGQATGCYNNGQNYWEPSDSVKGDTARILMYMYMHYSNEVYANASYSYAGNLSITNIAYTAEKTADAAWKMLLSWNDLDPVDTFESNRNNYCASITGTRNPFVDHPEYATSIWKNGANSGAIKNETPDDSVYQQVYSVDELEVDDVVIIAAANSDVALSTNQKTNNRGQSEITKYTDGTNNYLSTSVDTQLITLQSGTKDGTFAFYTGSGYLYAASSSNNYLKTETSLSDKSSWKIEIDATTGVANVVSQGTNTRNILKYNSSSSLFSCYATGNTQANISIYKRVDNTPGEIIVPPAYEFPEADSLLTNYEAYEVAIHIGSAHTTDKYYVSGIIESIDNTTYGNMTIKDSNGYSLYIYGVYNEDGTIQYNELSYKPQVGDTIKLYGILGTYNGLAQMKNAYIVEVTPYHEHNFGEVAYTWNDDFSICIATRTCSGTFTHEETETINSVSNTIEPTCTGNGSVTYTATFTNSAFEKQEHIESIAAKGHKYDDGVVTKEATQDEEGIKTFTCLYCDDSYTQAIDKLPPSPKGDKEKGCRGSTSSVFSILALASIMIFIRRTNNTRRCN